MDEITENLKRKGPSRTYKTQIFLYSKDENDIKPLYEDAKRRETQVYGSIGDFARDIYGSVPDNFTFHGGTIDEIRPVEKRGGFCGFEIISEDEDGCSAAFWANWIDDSYPSCRIAYATGCDKLKMYSRYDPDGVYPDMRYRLVLKNKDLKWESSKDIEGRDAFYKAIADSVSEESLKDMKTESASVKEDMAFFDRARVINNAHRDSDVEIAVYKYKNCSPHGVNIFVPEGRYGLEKDL